MNKRKTLSGAAKIAVAAAIVVSASAPAAAQETINLSFISGFPPVLNVIGAFVETYVPAVDAQLAKTGNYKINWNLAHSGQVVRPTGELEGVELGLGDIGVVPTFAHPDKLPLYELPFKVPFTTKSMDLMVRTVKMLEGKYPAYGEGWKTNNQVALFPSGAVDNYFILSPKPLTKFEDLKGMKIGAAGPNLAWVVGAGAAGVNMNIATAYNSLTTGIFEAAIGWAAAAGGFKLCEPAPYIFDTGFGAHQAVSMTVNADVMAALPDEIRVAIADNAEGWHVASDKKQKGGAAFMMNRCAKEFGATVTTMSEEDRRKWAFRLPNLAQDWAKRNNAKGLPATAILTDFMDALRAGGAEPVRNWDKE